MRGPLVSAETTRDQASTASGLASCPQGRPLPGSRGVPIPTPRRPPRPGLASSLNDDPLLGSAFSHHAPPTGKTFYFPKHQGARARVLHSHTHIHTDVFAFPPLEGGDSLAPTEETEGRARAGSRQAAAESQDEGAAGGHRRPGGGGRASRSRPRRAAPAAGAGLRPSRSRIPDSSPRGCEIPESL